MSDYCTDETIVKLALATQAADDRRQGQVKMLGAAIAEGNKDEIERQRQIAMASFERYLDAFTALTNRGIYLMRKGIL